MLTMEFRAMASWSFMETCGNIVILHGMLGLKFFLEQLIKEYDRLVHVPDLFW